MRELWSKVITYLRDKHNLRKVVITSAAVFLLLGVVLFSSDIQKLLNLPWGTRAEEGPIPGVNTTWDDSLPNLNTPRSNAKLIDVVDNAGNRWLYAIGGVNVVPDSQNPSSPDYVPRPSGNATSDNQRINLVKEVERIQINNNPDPDNVDLGKPIGTWQPVDAMNFGHTEFGLIVYGDYICVIAGDIHAYKVEDTLDTRAKKYPLVYSTIEILNYKEPAATWQVHSLLTGVNFYPEVTLIGDQLHIVGGVYGNPFVGNSFTYPTSLADHNIYTDYYTGSDPNMPDNLVAQDPIMLVDDFAAWDDPNLDLANKKRIGDIPLSTHRGGINGLITDPDGTNPDPGAPAIPPDGWEDGLLPEWFTLEKNKDIGWVFSEGVLNGRFYTTVSEHYVLDLTKTPNDPSFIARAGELGIDYTGTLYNSTDIWSMNRVVSLGHLRLTAYIAYTDTQGGTEYVVLAVSPVPQGRYGHKLVVHNGDLLVLGGASWSNPYKTASVGEECCDPSNQEVCIPLNLDDCMICYCDYRGGNNRVEKHHFWVIDDDFDPFTQVGGDDYEFVGNITYMWDPVHQYWTSTNANMAGSSGRELSNTYAFKSPTNVNGGNKKGRAFFGLAEMDFSATVPVSNNHLIALAVGGLQNSTDSSQSTIIIPNGDGSGSSTWFNVPVEVTHRTEKLAEDSIGWEDQLGGYVNGADEPINSYNLFSVGIDKYRSISFDGQTKFQYDEESPQQRITHPVHVPDYERTGDLVSGLINGDTSMFAGDQWWTMPGPDEDNNMNQLTFSAVKDVRSVDTDGKTTVYIYKIGGAVGPDSPPTEQRHWLPETSPDAQYLGPFTYGQPGVPDIGTSSFIVEPSEVNADGVSYATATLTLLDYYKEPVVGYKAVVATENNSAWPPVSTDNVLIRPFDTTQQPAPSPWPSPWLVTNALGEAKFRLTSVKELSDLVCVYVSDPEDIGPPTSKPDPYMMPCKPITFAGGASYLNSTIDADPIKVAADGSDFSTVTVTLFDHQSPPMPITTGDYFVKIIPDKNWVNVENINQQINEDGQAIFKIRSSTRGKTIIYARYSKSLAGLEDPDQYMTLADTATVEFGAMIADLKPDYGYQGQELPTVTATGKATHWNSTTKVEFIPPSRFGFHYKVLDSEKNIEDISIMANGQITPEIGIWAPNFPPSTDVTFTILDREDNTDPGDFWPDNDSDPDNHNLTCTKQTDATGRAYFRIQTSRDPGFTKIRATIGGNSSDLWLIFQDPKSSDPISSFKYELEVFASPNNLTSGQAVVRAAIYETNNTGRHLLTDALDFNFLTDATATAETLDPDTDESESGIAETTYTRNNENGRFHIFAWTEIPYGTDTIFVASKTIINHKPSTSDSTRITIGSITVPSVTELIANLVNIGQTAELGFWTFRTTTGGISENNLFDEEIAEYSFRVLPVGLGTGPYISINPWFGIKGTSNYRIDITGFGTHFDATSVVTFSPPAGGSSDGIKIIGAVHVTDQLLLDLIIDIDHDAYAGWWSVSVTTGGEVAEVPGNYDFRVRGISDYDITVTPDPSEIVRDGSSRSKITATLVYVDPLTGNRTATPNQTVYFTVIEGIGLLSAQSAVTNQYGQAMVQYTADEGEENTVVRIMATVTPPDGVTIDNRCSISLVVNPWIYTLVANPTEIPLLGTPDRSTLTISGLPTGERIPITLHFDNAARGSIMPAVTTSALDGTATSMYLAADERITEIVRIYALATIPGKGQVRSNVEEIQIGRDASKYRIEVIAVPNSVIAGGAQRSTVTATLRYQSQVVVNQQIDFALVEAASGDYLTTLSGRTDANGALTTEFVPGNIEGAVVVRAYPAGIGLYGDAIITKTADKFPDECMSHISAVSHYVPANGTSYSVVTVTLRNSNYVPIIGQLVTISTNNTKYNVKLANGTAGNSAVTNVKGQAIFRVSSDSLVGTCNVTAIFNASFDLKTDIIFETDGSLISQYLKIVVPFEMRDYDNLTWIYLTENALTNGYFINEMYTKEARPDNEIKDLSNILIYLHPNKTYTMWAKGRYHKAKIKTFTTGTIGQGDIILISLDELPIGDLLPGPPADATASPPKTPFHDNYVNAIDAGLFFSQINNINVWFHDHYLADFTLDKQVNSIDFNMVIKNWGPGAQGAPSPRCPIS